MPIRHQSNNAGYYTSGSPFVNRKRLIRSLVRQEAFARTTSQRAHPPPNHHICLTTLPRPAGRTPRRLAVRNRTARSAAPAGRFDGSRCRCLIWSFRAFWPQPFGGGTSRSALNRLAFWPVLLLLASIQQSRWRRLPNALTFAVESARIMASSSCRVVTLLVCRCRGCYESSTLGRAIIPFSPGLFLLPQVFGSANSKAGSFRFVFSFRTAENS
jgi:hypothetical protein